MLLSFISRVILHWLITTYRPVIFVCDNQPSVKWFNVDPQAYMLDTI